MRDELIKAAIEKFGRRGYDAVGTREIAAAVDTPMSSITYHFGGKEGLYLAAAEHIFDFLQETVGPLMEEMPGPDASREERLALICRVLRGMGAMMLSEKSASFALFISREQQLPTPQVLDLMSARVLPMMRLLVEQVANLRPDLSEDEAKAVTLYLFGMVIALRHTRASMRLLFECEKFTEKKQGMLLDQLEQSVRAILDRGTG